MFFRFILVLSFLCMALATLAQSQKVNCSLPLQLRLNHKNKTKARKLKLVKMKNYVDYWDARPLSYDDPSEEYLLLFKKDPAILLSGEETSSLIDYLRGSKINLALRGQHDSYFNPVLLNLDLELMRDNLDSALMKLNSYNGFCFRGASLSEIDLRQLKVGQQWSDPGFLSFSLMYAKAQAFSRSKFSNLRDVVFVLDAKDAKVVPSKLYHRNEAEVIFPRHSSFEVLKVDRTHNPTLIYLSEI
jgi:hypothetical protein